MSTPGRRDLSQVERTNRFVWYAFLLAPFVYVGVAYLLMETRPDGPAQPLFPASLRIVFLAVAILCFFGAFGLRRSLVSRSAGDARPPAGRIQTTAIVPWAVLEAIAVLGLILVVLGGRLTDAIVFAAIAFAGLLRMPPEGRGQLEEGMRGQGDH